MDKILQETLLFDFYGELLTPKQRLFYEMYHLQDFSLSEIGEAQGVSPQAARDLIKRTEKILLRYETILGLVAKYQEQSLLVAELRSRLGLLKESLSDPLLRKEMEALMNLADRLI